MTELERILQESMIWIEGLAAVVSLLCYNRIKNQYWRYFSYYLVLMFLCELFGKWGDNIVDYNKPAFYNYFVIPIEFIFFYWLYAAKSFGKPKLFCMISALYLLSFIPNEILMTKKIIFSFNYTFGCLILMGLVVMEYYKQINSSNILNFNKNPMFYINLGVTLFYIGTLPFWAFFAYIRVYREIYHIYFSYFLGSGIVMYLLFSISFIWGRRNS
ncbi:hypothetical protein ODZ84_16880 [Chryseobacterium fluminis]|uniref:hypothetical protein n=1 Tax=Chryseobacterium fluminis TaxID=2983606 RepID=UPI0022540C57|nr:hypothetical protein [Chryseobacterium sp. MMS21-Ot14]UZT96879.1 hypothetical protein ODZ84_16880 [Chryseobacterium sp. MMS21-Ot14]